jgi:hypothetical protein
MLSVCMSTYLHACIYVSICMDVRLVKSCTVRRTFRVYHPTVVPGEPDHLQKEKPFRSAENKMSISSRRVVTILISFHRSVEIASLNKCAYVYLQEYGRTRVRGPNAK